MKNVSGRFTQGEGGIRTEVSGKWVRRLNAIVCDCTMEAYVGGGMTHVTKDKTVYMLGRLIAPVYKNGTLLSYPPVNSHHAHSAPYDSHEMVKRNIPSRTAAFTRYSASNNILAAGYTDGLCHEDEGGKG